MKTWLRAMLEEKYIALHEAAMFKEVIEANEIFDPPTVEQVELTF